jgi:hypothetical protein
LLKTTEDFPAPRNRPLRLPKDIIDCQPHDRAREATDTKPGDHARDMVFGALCDLVEPKSALRLFVLSRNFPEKGCTLYRIAL